jgi:sec-independent protein translocase protein TatA
MGFGGISMGSLLLIFLIVLVLFGTKKLRTIGEDLGQAVRSFRKGLQEPMDQESNNSDKKLP